MANHSHSKQYFYYNKSVVFDFPISSSIVSICFFPFVFQVMYLPHLFLIALLIWHLTRDADLRWISGSICLDYPLLLFPFISIATADATVKNAKQFGTVVGIGRGSGCIPWCVYGPMLKRSF